MSSLLPTTAITTAVTAVTSNVLIRRNAPPESLVLQANFVYGSGGTAADAWVQSSFDGGVTWTDIANFHFTTTSARKVFNLSRLTPVTTQATPGDGVLGANTCIDGLLGTHYRVKYTTTGTYAGGTTLQVSCNELLVQPAAY